MALDSRSSDGQPRFDGAGRVRTAFVRLFNAVAVVLAAPLGLCARLEALCSDNAEGMFIFGAQAMAGVPGYPGIYLRRAYYWWTLRSCSLRCFIGYGAYFTHRLADVEDHAYVGAYAMIGCAHLGVWSLTGSRTSILNGGSLHSQDDEGRWLPADLRALKQIHIGAHAWIGEGAILMANVGERAMVAAGAVVAAPVTDRVLVAGNPARFVRRLERERERESSL